MLTVNLLFSRYQRQQHEKMVARRLLLITFTISLLLSIIVYMLYAVCINRLHREVNTLEFAISAHQQAMQNAMLSHTKDEQMVAFSRTLFDFKKHTQQLLANLVNANQQVCLTEMKREKNKVLLYGYAASITELILYMKQLQAHTHFLSMTLDRLKQENNNNGLKFTLHGLLKNNFLINFSTNELEENI